MADASAPSVPPAPESLRVSPGRARVLMALGAVFFGAMAVATRGASAELGAAQIAVVRFAIGLFGVVAWTVVSPRAFRATRPGLLVLRGTIGGVAVLLYFQAIGLLSAGMATLLNYTFPLWAAIFAAIFLGERLGARLLAGMALATAGLVVVVGPGELVLVARGLGDPAMRAGLAIGLVSSVFGGAATTVIRAVRQTDSALAVFGAFCLFGGLVCLPFALDDWRPVSERAAALLALAGVLSFVAQLLFTYALRYVTAGAGSLTTQLTVVASYGFAALFLGEPVGWNAVVGGGIVMAGVVLASGRS